jgi:hypothetical protein
MKKGRIPKSILSQLNECTGGGFLLFSCDNKGNVNVESHFDNNLFAMSLTSYVKNWAEAVDQVTLDNLIKGINENLDDQKGDDCNPPF